MIHLDNSTLKSKKEQLKETRKILQILSKYRVKNSCYELIHQGK